VAVVKAAKKRNRHLAESFGAESIRPLQALELLVSASAAGVRSIMQEFDLSDT